MPVSQLSSLPSCIARACGSAEPRSRQHVEDMWRQGPHLNVVEGLEMAHVTPVSSRAVIKANSQSHTQTRAALRRSQIGDPDHAPQPGRPDRPDAPDPVPPVRAAWRHGKIHTLPQADRWGFANHTAARWAFRTPDCGCCISGCINPKGPPIREMPGPLIAANKLILLRKLERANGFEPSTLTLARLCSTPELRPHSKRAGYCLFSSGIQAANPCG
jgi:hypothetical protein